MIAKWLDTARAWPVTASPVYRTGDEAFIARGGFRFVYYSPYRPLDFVLGMDCVITKSTEPFREYLFTKAALPVERVSSWQLVPVGETWQAYEEAAR